MTYQNNEKVIIIETLENAKIVAVSEDSQEVQVELKDGTTSWKNFTDVAKMLTEVNPPDEGKKLL